MLALRAVVLVSFVALGVRAAPRFAPEFEVHPGAERELLVTYTYGHALTWTGSGWASSWQDNRSGTTTLYGALVDLDGGVALEGTRVLLDVSEAASISGASSCRFQDRLLFSVSNYEQVSRFVWTTLDLQPLRRDSAAGGSSGPRVLECSGPRPLWAAVVVGYRSGTSYLALSLKELDGDGGVFPVDGGALLAPDLDIAGSERVGPSVAYDGAQHLVVWAAGGLDGGGAGSDLWGAFVTPGQGAGAPFLLVGGVGHQADPRLGWNGSQYALAWTQGDAGARDLYVRRVSANGVPGPVNVVAAAAADEHSPRLVFDGVELVLTWQEQPQGNLFSTLRAATLSNGNVASGPLAVRNAWADELHLAPGPPGVTLFQQRDFSHGIRPVVSRLRGAAVEPVDGGVLELAQTLRAQRAPNVLPGAGGPLLTWLEGTTTLAALGDGGVLTLPAGLRLAARDGGYVGLTLSGSALSLAWFDEGLNRLDGGLTSTRSTYRIGASQPVQLGLDEYLTTFENRSDGGSEVALEEVRRDGTAGQRWTLAVVPAPVGAPGLARNDAGALLAAWAYQYRVQAACVSGAGGAGAVIDLGAASYYPNPQVAGDGEGFLVVFVADESTGGAALRAVRFDAQCQVLDPTPLVLGRTGFSATSSPSLIFDGQQYVVAFPTGPDPRGDVSLVRVARDGTVTAPLLVAGDPQQGEHEAKVWADRAGHWLVVYGRFLRDERQSARRLFGVWLTDDANGARCATGADCESTVCVAGTCCDRACSSSPEGCEACTVALGAARDGTCGPRGSGSVCRAASTTCDPVERCDGASLLCPADVTREGGEACTALACAADAGQRLEVPCGALVSFPAQTVPVLPVAEAAEYSVAACGGALPPGVSLDAQTGAAQWDPAPAAPGTARLVFLAQGATSSASTTLEVVTVCEPPQGAQRSLRVGCGCEAGGAGWLFLTALGPWAAARRRRCRLGVRRFE